VRGVFGISQKSADQFVCRDKGGVAVWQVDFFALRRNRDRATNDERLYVFAGRRILKK